MTNDRLLDDFLQTPCRHFCGVTLLLADSINKVRHGRTDLACAGRSCVKVSCCSCVWWCLVALAVIGQRFGTTGLHVLLQDCIAHADAVGLHGDIAQQRRAEIVQEFLDDHSVIVATNVLARGVDLQNVHQVILMSRLLNFHLHTLRLYFIFHHLSFNLMY